MKIKRSAEALALSWPGNETRPDLRTPASKRMSRPSKLEIIERGRNKLSVFYARNGFKVF